MADSIAQYNPMGDTLGLTLIKNANREIRMGFVKKVYSILTAQLLLTVFVASVVMRQPKSFIMDNQWLLTASMAGSLATICAMSCCPDLGRKFPLNYGLLIGFTLCESVLVGVVCMTYSVGSVMLALGCTATIFLGMTVFAWTTKRDFTGMFPYMFGALLALVAFSFGVGILRMAFGVAFPFMDTVCAGFSVLLFTMFIVYDTQLIIGEFGGHKTEFAIDDYVFAALNLYLDIINLFLELLRLLGQTDNQ